MERILTDKSEEASSQRTALVVFTIRVASAVLAFASQVLLARWMGSFEYGIFVAVWTGLIIVATLVSFGMPTAAVRFVARYKQRKRPAYLWGMVRGSLGITAMSSFGLGILGFLLIYFSALPLPDHFQTPIMLATLCLPVVALTNVMEGIGRPFNWSLLSFLPTFIFRPIGILVLMAVALVLGATSTAITAMVATVLATYLVGIWQYLRLQNKLGKAVPFVKPSYRLKNWFLIALPIFLVESFYVLLTSMDVLFVSFMMKPEDTAVYFASTKILALVHFVYFAVRAAASHRYSAYHASRNFEGLREFVGKSIAWTFWPSLFLGVFMIATGKYFLMLFGNEFVAGVSFLYILVIGIVIRASVGPAESLLVMTNNQKSCAWVYVLALFVNVTLNLSLIPSFGLNGAAIATAVAMVFESAALYTIIRHKLSLHAFIVPARNDVQPTGEAF
ncbi:MAG: oligosaccharide flippase family protein [Rhizobiaceae bacterium]|nr:oligosaccharide flippase family protein [Rhizobiaceae bacterium]